jgi:lysine-specific demethylase 8
MNVDEVPVIDFQLEVEKIASSFSGSQFENDLIDHGGAPCVPLITKLCEFILNKNQDAVIIAKELSEVSWQQLHTGHWKDVALAWRQLYSLACLLSVLIDRLHSPNKVTHSDKIDQIKLLDKALLMGGPHYADLIHKLVDVIHAELIVELEQNNNNNDSVKEKKGDNSEDKAVEHERQVGQKYKSDQLDEAEEPPKKRLRLLHAMALQSRIKPAPVIDAEHQIKRIKPPSLLTFKQQYMDLNEPVVIEDLIHHWRAVWRWKDVSYLRSISGYRTVPVEIGQHYIHTDWSQQLMTLNEFIDIYITAEKPPSNHEDAGKIGYVAQTELFEQIPKLKADFTIPEYTSMSEKDTLIVHAWYGPGGTISPLHQDPYHNLLAQPVGSKYIRLYAPNEPVYPHEGDKILFNTSQVDVEKPDYGNFPKFKEATYSETILRAGDVLYIPPKYWHYLRSLETSFSVSFWWE